MKREFVKPIASVLVVTLALLGVAQSRVQAMLAPASTVQNAPQVDRTADLQTIQSTLEQKMVRARLHALGLSDAEIQTRLSQLTDEQVHQLASQIRAINPAGEWLIGLLFVVLLVVLIIYLVKRI